MAQIITVQVQDAEGAVKSIPFYEDDAVTVAEAQAWIDDALPELYDLIGGKVVDITFTVNLTIPGTQTGKPAAGTRVDYGAVLAFRNANGVGHSMYIPTFLASKLVKKVVNDDSDVTAFTGKVTAIGNGTPADENGLSLLEYRGGKQSTRKP